MKTLRITDKEYEFLQSLIKTKEPGESNFCDGEFDKEFRSMEKKLSL